MIAGAGETLLTFRGPLIRDIVSRGHALCVLAPELPKATAVWLDELGIRHHEIPLSRTGLNPLAELYLVLALRRLLCAERPDIVFAYHIKAVIFGTIAARLAGVGRIYSMLPGLGYAFSDGGPRQRIVGAIARGLYRPVLRRNERVFFQNPDDRELFVRLRLVDAGKAVLVNGSGVDLEHFSVTPLPPSPTFLMIARLLRDKGVREYVDAARRLRKTHPAARCLLVGGMDENPMAIGRQELEGWMGEKVIEYLGRLEDVRPAIAQSLVYVLPSYREGTPKTVLEAMAMGRPIITTEAPGCRETVKQGVNGYLVPVRQVPPLIKAMENFIRSPELASSMGAESRKMAESRYDVRKVNAALLSVMNL